MKRSIVVFGAMAMFAVATLLGAWWGGSLLWQNNIRLAGSESVAKAETSTTNDLSIDKAGVGAETASTNEGKPVDLGDRSGHASVSHKGKLYVMGGINWHWSLTNSENYSDVLVSEDGISWQLASQNRQFHRYSSRWDFEGHQLLSHNGKLFFLKGFYVGRYPGNAHIMAVSDDGYAWTEIQEQSNLNTLFFEIGVSHRNKIYALGRKPEDAKQSWNNTALWTSDEGYEWKLLSYLGRDFAKSGDRHTFLEFIVHNDQFFLFVCLVQGKKCLGNAKYSVWRSDDGVNWQDIGETPFLVREGPALASHRGKLYFTGGMERGVYVIRNDVWSSVDAKQWQRLTARADFLPRQDHTLVSHRNKLYLIAGRVAHYVEGSEPRQYKFSSNDVWASEQGLYWHRLQ